MHPQFITIVCVELAFRVETGNQKIVALVLHHSARGFFLCFHRDCLSCARIDYAVIVYYYGVFVNSLFVRFLGQFYTTSSVRVQCFGV